VKNEELQKVKEERNILYTTQQWKANGTGHILHRNRLLKHVIEGRIEGSERRGRRCKELLDDLKETRRYWKLKEDAPDRILCGTRFGRGRGTVERHTT
jgi:hypothetical protein